MQISIFFALILYLSVKYYIIMSRTITLNEQQLTQIINEGIKYTLKEAVENENFKGFIKGFGGAFKGAKQGFQNSRIMSDTDVNNRSQYDTKDPFSNQWRDQSNLKDAAAEVKRMYQLAKQYRTYANRLQARAQSMEKYANLEKTGKGADATFAYRDFYGQGGSGQQVTAMDNRRQAGQARYRNI